MDMNFIRKANSLKGKTILSGFKGTQEENLEKAKYFKREGTPGNYKYYYTEEQYKKAKGKEKDAFKKQHKEGDKLVVKNTMGEDVTYKITKVFDNDKYELTSQGKDGKNHTLNLSGNDITELKKENSKSEKRESKEVPTMKTFSDLAKNSKDVDSFISEVKKIKNVPKDVADEFFKKYGNDGDYDIKEAAMKFFNEHNKVNKEALDEQVNEYSSGEQEELFLAKKYVDEMIKRHKDYKTIRKNILSNLVNSEYGRTSNNFITKVWDELNKRFPS